MATQIVKLGGHTFEYTRIAGSESTQSYAYQCPACGRDIRAGGAAMKAEKAVDGNRFPKPVTVHAVCTVQKTAAQIVAEQSAVAEVEHILRTNATNAAPVDESPARKLAKFSSRCPVCHLFIETGSPIYLEGSRWICENCI